MIPAFLAIIVASQLATVPPVIVAPYASPVQCLEQARINNENDPDVNSSEGKEVGVRWVCLTFTVGGPA